MWRAAFLAFALAPAAVAETWTIGTEADYAPFVYHDATGALTGFDKQFGDELCLRAKVECIWVEVPFDTLFSGLADGQFDIVIAGIGATPERERTALFTAPYRHVGNNFGAFAGLSDGVPIESARIGVQAGTVHEAWLQKTGRDVHSYPSYEAALDALLSRQVDLVFGSTSYMQHAFENGYPQLRNVGGEEFPSSGTAVAVRRNAPEIRDRIDAIIAAMEADGTLDMLDKVWFVAGDPA